ncbi:hypothetical protein R3P38DRAFT_2969533 [Favolaschia claudopus]|uniref:DUF7918 domain-containing protein n=1 Tax=Favolaschia claudopus TaxID=2862362 RepID=A0AAW0B3Q5_9AGAR
MLTFRGFSAWIVVDGKPVPQYLVAEDPQASRISCWIPGDEGQNFSVHWKDHGGKIDSCAFITLDGLVVPGRFLFGSGEASRSGVRTSARTERPFMFQTIEEDETLDQAINKEAGMINLRIKRVERVAGRPANPLQKLPESLCGKRKAGDICVGFGEETETFDQYAYTWSIKPHAKDGPANGRVPKTYVSFVFRYRTREWLQMQGIMPEGDASLEVPGTRTSMRRISSAPAVPPPATATQEPTLITPRASPTPPKKKIKLAGEDKPFLGDGPRRPRRPSADMRRTVSFQIPSHILSSGHLIGFDDVKEEDDPGDPDWMP